MSPSKRAYLDAIYKTQEMGYQALRIQALHRTGLAQEIVDNLNLAPEDYIPAEHEGGGVTPELADAVGKFMREDAAGRRRSLVLLRDAMLALPKKRPGVIADLSDRIKALDRIVGE